MTKKVRGTARTHRRPGARPSVERSAPRRPLTEGSNSSVEPARAADEYVVEDGLTVAVPDGEPERPTVHPRHRVKAGSLLATRAATEYVYVAQDMRRILAVSSMLVAVLVVLWLLIVVMRVIELPFY